MKHVCQGAQTGTSAQAHLPNQQPTSLRLEKLLQGKSEGSEAPRQNVIKIYPGAENQKPPN